MGIILGNYFCLYAISYKCNQVKWRTKYKQIGVFFTEFISCFSTDQTELSVFIYVLRF